MRCSVSLYTPISYKNHIHLVVFLLVFLTQIRIQEKKVR